MSAVLRHEAPDSASARAKSLRPGEPSTELQGALAAFARSADEHARRHDAETERARKLAAFSVVVALSREARRPVSSLSPSLVAAVERWEDGEFGGTSVDVEIAEQAAWELLADGS